MSNGYINFVLGSDIQKFEGALNCNFDLLNNFIKWLEDLLFVNKEYKFEFEFQNEKFMFDIDRRNIFTILKDDSKEVIFEQKTDRAKFVAEAYKSFFSIVKTSDFQGYIGSCNPENLKSDKIELFIEYNF